MNKKQQIEEMAGKMPEKIKDPLDNSRYIIFGKSLRREIARIYYNAGYRQIDENCAVITKAELKDLKRRNPEIKIVVYRQGSATPILKDC